MYTRIAKINEAQIISNIQILAWRAAYINHMPEEYLANIDESDITNRWRKALSEPSPGIINVALPLCQDSCRAPANGIIGNQTGDGKST